MKLIGIVMKEVGKEWFMKGKQKIDLVHMDVLTIYKRFWFRKIIGKCGIC